MDTWMDTLAEEFGRSIIQTRDFGDGAGNVLFIKNYDAPDRVFERVCERAGVEFVSRYYWDDRGDTQLCINPNSDVVGKRYHVDEAV